jgi:hypothetical protein
MNFNNQIRVWLYDAMVSPFKNEKIHSLKDLKGITLIETQRRFGIPRGIFRKDVCAYLLNWALNAIRHVTNIYEYISLNSPTYAVIKPPPSGLRSIIVLPTH